MRRQQSPVAWWLIELACYVWKLVAVALHKIMLNCIMKVADALEVATLDANVATRRGGYISLM